MNAGDIHHLKVGRSGFAMIDAADARFTAGWRWTWHRIHGVIGHCEGQRVFLHQMISPHKRTTFKDGDKRNCRRSNLVAHVTRIPREHCHRPKSRLGNLHNDKVGQRYVFNRKVSHKGEVFMWATSRSYKHRGKAAALKLARQLAREIMQLSRESFIQFVRWTRGKKTTHEILSTWTAFEGGSASWNEVMRTDSFRCS